MKTSLLRPDQIYTLEFTDGHGTVTHRVSDFQPRELQNLEKMYLEGQFGGLPAYAQMQKNLIDPDICHLQQCDRENFSRPHFKGFFGA